MGEKMKESRDKVEQKTVNQEKRRFLQKAAYMAPAVLTLTAMPFTASYGSEKVKKVKKDKKVKIK
jgi:hypothetical protein